MRVRDSHISHSDTYIGFFVAAKEGKRLVVIGSSFISMELVAAVSKRKLASIDVIGMEEYPFEAVLGKEVGKGLKQVSRYLSVRKRTGLLIKSTVPRISRRHFPYAMQGRQDRPFRIR